jgi:deoxyribodipyrimidine photo-lyase
MISGLRKVERELTSYNIPFILTIGRPAEELSSVAEKYRAAALVTDFSPLRLARAWKSETLQNLKIPCFEVDAHNIVPCRAASDKKEYAAYTIRPKLKRLLPEYLDDFPRVQRQSRVQFEVAASNWKAVPGTLKVDQAVGPVSSFKPGETEALRVLDRFLEGRMQDYAERRNDPNSNAQTELSPYLHFGQISAQRVALEIQRFDTDLESREALLEQLIIRRELAENFCFYEPEYDSWSGLPEWGRKTLDEHRSDPRQYVYSRSEFESGATHDDLWNAAQQEMMVTGKMHGYLRMYWAKKILEWSVSPEEALATAIYLNDRYPLDGRDPNGYAGIAWSIGGLHDRPWFERDIFGKIRFMSYSGCARKFDVKAYIRRSRSLSEGESS